MSSGLIVLAIFLLVRFVISAFGNKSGNTRPDVPGMPAPKVTGRAPAPAPGQRPTFEELLREIRGSEVAVEPEVNKPEWDFSQFEEIGTKPVNYETENKEKVAPESAQIKATMAQYEEKRLQSHKQEPTPSIDYGKIVFNEYKLPTTERNIYSEALHNPAELRKAFVLSEILKRREG